jgi:hypothetical protein
MKTPERIIKKILGDKISKQKLWEPSSKGKYNDYYHCDTCGKEYTQESMRKENMCRKCFNKN